MEVIELSDDDEPKPKRRIVNSDLKTLAREREGHQAQGGRPSCADGRPSSHSGGSPKEERSELTHRRT